MAVFYLRVNYDYRLYETKSRFSWIARKAEGTLLAGGHLNMTKPALISQTNKRGTGHPAESWGGQNTHYSPSTSSTARRGKEDVVEVLRASAGCYRHTVGSLRKERVTVGWLRRDNA